MAKVTPFKGRVAHKDGLVPRFQKVFVPIILGANQIDDKYFLATTRNLFKLDEKPNGKIEWFSKKKKIIYKLTTICSQRVLYQIKFGQPMKKKETYLPIQAQLLAATRCIWSTRL